MREVLLLSLWLALYGQVVVLCMLCFFRIFGLVENSLCEARIWLTLDKEVSEGALSSFVCDLFLARFFRPFRL